jgi:RHS repeat-associated protein
MTRNVTPTVQTYTYDEENRLTGAAGYTYTYDGDGNRVRKSNGNMAADGTLYWNMTPGVVAESDLAGTTKSEYIFFDGERVARRDGATGAGGVFYYFSDHLKTASVITDSAGVIKAESDYYPWGGELQFVNNDSNDYKFTGKKRDLETGLDYFGARYYSNGLGRWVSADWSTTPVPVPYAVLGDPQSLNLYTYVRNTPTTTMDPDGHCIPVCDIVAKLAQWFGTAAMRDGGAKPAAQNAGIGAGKGTGMFVLNTVRSALSTGTPVWAGVGPGAMTVAPAIPTPAVLKPSNQTQAEVSTATQGTLMVASVLITGGRSGPSAAANAQGALDLGIASRVGNPSVMVGAFDSTTGATAVGSSGPLSRLGAINPDLAAAADQIGGVGAMNPGAPSPVGCCAEFDAANQLMNRGSSLGDIGFTDAIRPSNGKVIPKCENCEKLFPDK